MYYVFVDGTNRTTIGRYTVKWTPGVANGSFLDSLTGYITSGVVGLFGSETTGYWARLQEHSPATISATVVVSSERPFLAFGYRVITPGDGDEFQVCVNGATLSDRAS